MSSPHAESRATSAGKWLLAAVIPASALALGSVPAAALMVVSLLAALACVLLWWDAAVPTSRASRAVLLALAVLLGMTVLQAVPLPDALARALAPANADIWERALSPLREPGPAWHTLSVAPSATRVEVLRGFFYACVFLGALRIAKLEHGERFLVRLIVLSSSLIAISALAHAAVSAEKVFGIYRPRELWAYKPGRFSPLLNINHLAAYLNIGACVGFAALVSRAHIPRALSGSATLILAATSLWQSSRGATGTLCFGLALVIGLTFYTRKRFDSARAEGAILAACAAAATIVVAISLSEGREHLVSRDLIKVNVAKSSLSLMAASPWFGSGRGAFETVFSSVRQGSTYVTFTHPEDFIVQWLVEWGAPASIVGAGLLGWAVRPQVLLRAVRPAIGVWVAIVVGVLHELVDYHFEVPGVVALVAVCVAVVVSGRASSRSSPEGRPGAWARRAAFVVSAGVVVAAVVVAPDVGHSLAEERRALSAMAVDKTVPPERFESAARAAMLRYPAEPFLPLMGAVRAQAQGEGSVVPWVARSLERNPRFGRAHFVLAQSLASGHAAQARLEYRLAYEHDEELRDSIVKQAVFVVEDSSSALELVPDGPSGLGMLEALVKALASRLPSTSVILDQEIERRSPGAPGPFRRRAEAAASDAINGAPWCERTNDCKARALDTAEELAKREPTACESHARVARLRISMGRAEVTRALDALQRAADTVVDRGECQRQLIQLSFASGEVRRGEMALERLVRGGCGATAECIDLYVWAGNMEEGRGHYLRAVRLYRRAFDLTPDREDLLEHIGSLGERDGALADALDAYGTLASRHPSDARWPARIEELRARVRIAPSPTSSIPGMPVMPRP